MSDCVCLNVSITECDAGVSRILIELVSVIIVRHIRCRNLNLDLIPFCYLYGFFVLNKIHFYREKQQFRNENANRINCIDIKSRNCSRYL